MAINDSSTDSKPLADQSETPEDVATLYSWANLHGAKYRDFSASRAQAREEARLRAEDAAAEERRRQEEEAERIRQEESQLAARLAAEAAEAARQAEAERLAEIARQAEAERQAVLAAQEAQRQAVQQRGWQPPPSEVYQSEYSPSFVASNSPYESSSNEREPDQPLVRSSAPQFTEPYRVMEPIENLSKPPQAAQTFQPLPPFEASPSGRYVAGTSSHAAQSSQSSPMHSAASNAYRDNPVPPYVAPSQPSYPVPQQDPYLAAPWQQPEHREVISRPAWLAPELPAASAPYSGNPQRPEPSHSAPAPQYGQTYGQVPGQYSGRGQGSRQNPNQVPGAAPAAAPIEDTQLGSSDQVANRWYALKHIFDPNPGQAAQAEQVPALPPARVPVLAVFSLAGGVGKTSMVASLGRALSARGERVLLVDTAAYGLLPFFFGARDQRPGMLRTFNPPGVSAEAPIQLVTLDPEGQAPESKVSNHSSNQDPNRAQGSETNQDWLAQEVSRYSRGANRVLIDLPTASGSTTRRVLRLAPVVLVPILPDMNSVVSVGAIEGFFRNSAAMAGTGGGKPGGQPIMPYYVLNQFDYSLPLHLDVREILREQIGDRLLPFALRRSPAVSEALAEGMTVIDYAPSAVVAEDYAHLAEWVRSLSAPATQSYRGVRWSER